MAYVPDEAVDAMHQISKSAFLIYVYLCRRRNHRTGVCFPSLRTIAEECGVEYSYASLMRAELIKKGWLDLSDDGELIPVKGFESKSLENPESVLENPKHDFGKSQIAYKGINQQIEPTNLTNKRGRPKTASRGSRIPSDFEVTESMIEWAQSRGIDFDLEFETEKFRNHFMSVSGAKGVKLDWVATWRNWMLNAMQYRSNSNNGRGNGINQGSTYKNRERLAGYEELFERYRNGG
jgi:hypothetical protein